MNDSMRCGRLLEKKSNGKEIYCGKTKVTREGTILEYCEVCEAFNLGREKGFREKIQSTKKCQMITCNKKANRIICEGEYLIYVCKGHSNGRQWREIADG